MGDSLTVYYGIAAGLSDRLYHRTSGENALSILKSNTFHLVQSEANESEMLHRRKALSYFMSTARALTSTFLWRGGVDRARVVFNLDGVKIRQNLSGGPISYYGDRDSASTFEAEDRIESNSPYIKDAKKYIESVHVYVMPEGKLKEYVEGKDKLLNVDPTSPDYATIYWNVLQSGILVLGESIEDIRKIKVECLRKSIPVFFYFDVMKFKVQRGGSNLPLKYFDKLLQGLPNKERIEPLWNPDVSGYAKKGNLLPWLMLMNLPTISGVDEASSKKRRDLILHHSNVNGVKKLDVVYGNLRRYSEGKMPSLESMIRNDMFQSSISKYDHPMRERANMNLLIEGMRKKGITNLKGLLEYLSGKWFPEN